jgi:hypothetical protein
MRTHEISARRLRAAGRADHNIVKPGRHAQLDRLLRHSATLRAMPSNHAAFDGSIDRSIGEDLRISATRAMKTHAPTHGPMRQSPTGCVMEATA